MLTAERMDPEVNNRFAVELLIQVLPVLLSVEIVFLSLPL